MSKERVVMHYALLAKMSMSLLFFSYCLQADYVEHDVRNQQTFGSVQASLVDVYDGDTIKVFIKDFPSIIGDRVSIRFVGLNAPEITSKNPLVRSLAFKVKEYVLARIKSAKSLWLRNMQRDKYFRILADVWVDGYSLNARLLELGCVLSYDGGTVKPWESFITESLAKKITDSVNLALKQDVLLPSKMTSQLDAIFAQESCWA